MQKNYFKQIANEQSVVNRSRSGSIYITKRDFGESERSPRVCVAKVMYSQMTTNNNTMTQSLSTTTSLNFNADGNGSLPPMVSKTASREGTWCCDWLPKI